MKRFWLGTTASRASHRFLSKELVYSVSAGIWLVLVAMGLGFLMQYANAPGDQGHALRSWPIDSGIPRSESKPTLLVFAHPKCPCTEATLDQLSIIMSRCRDKVDCHVLFFHADGEGSDWIKAGCWKSAASIDGVKIASDPQSRSAERFGVRTSGHVLLYDRGGDLLFEGGITPSRGHSGDNPGRDILLSLIRTRTAEFLPPADSNAPLDSTCVFGCPLHSPEVSARRMAEGSEG